MADEINFEVTGFGQLRQQLREAQLEMIKLAESGKQGTAEFIKAAQKAGQIKEAIKDASDAANVFTTEGKFKAVTSSLAAISGGFTAVQGAIGLVSDDTKAFEETFKKLQSAMALTQGLTALSEMGDAFKNLGSVAVATFRSIQAAIGSTGIGLLIIGIGAAVTALIMNFDKLIPKTRTLADELNTTEEELKTLSAATAKQTTSVNLLFQAVTDQTRSEKERKAALDKLKEEYPNYFNNLTNDINDTKTLTEQKDKLINTLIREARVRASQEEIEKIAAKNIGQRMLLNKQLAAAQKAAATAEAEARAITFKTTKDLKDYTLPTEEEWTETIKAQPEAFEKSQKAFAKRLQAQTKEAEIQAKINALNAQELKDSGVFLDIISEETAAIQANGGASDAKAEKVTTNTKKEITATKDRNEALRKLDEERATAGLDLITTQFANNLSRLKEAQQEELKQQELTDEQRAQINKKYAALIELNEQQRINAVAKYEKAASDKAAKDAQDFEANRKASAEKEYRDRKSEIDKIYDEKKLAIEKEEISEEKKQKKLDQLELDRLEKQKINAEDYVATVEEADNDVVDIALKTQEKLKEIDKKTKEERISAFKEYADTAINLAQGITDAIAAKNDAEKQMEIERVKSSKQSEEEKAKAIDAINKEYFEKDKQVQIANSIISTLAGALNAFMSTLKVDPTGITGSILAAAALAAGYFQVEKIRATTYQSSLPSGSTEGAKPAGSRYAEGGVLGGPTHDMGGIRTAFGELEGGEFVVNRRATANFLPLLEMINAQGNIAGPEMPRSTYQPVIKTYVLATEVTSAQEANAKIAGLARLT